MDLKSSAVTLEGWEQFGCLAVLVRPDSRGLLAGEAAAADGRSTDPGWESGFAAMPDDAHRNGWIAGGGAVPAHVVWIGS